MGRSATSSPVAPPPPPPPPPPQLELEDAQATKPMDFRNIMALFHAHEPAPGAWEALWQATLAEASAKRTQPPPQQYPRVRVLSAAEDNARAMKSAFSVPDPSKRPRQLSGVDLEPNKLSRLNRGPVRPKAGGSKLLQKLGGTRGT